MRATAQMGPTTAPAIAAPEMPLLLGTADLVADDAAIPTVGLVSVVPMELCPPDLTTLVLAIVLVIKTLVTTVVGAAVFWTCTTVAGAFVDVASHVKLVDEYLGQKPTYL
jgi:hypothetical protein